MRIAIATPTFPPDIGGVAQVALRQANYLRSKGHEIYIFSGNADSPEAHTPLAPDIEVRRFGVKVSGFPRYAAGDKFGVQPTTVRGRYLDALRAAAPDVIISHCWQAWNTDWLITDAPDLTNKLAIFSHGTSIHSTHGKAGILRRLRWSQYERTHLVPGLSRAAGFLILEDHEDLERFFDVRIARRLGVKYAVVPNGFNPEIGKLHQVREKYSEEKVALFVGQFTKDKGADFVFEAFQAHMPEGWRLDMCGSVRTKLLDKLQRKADPRVSFHIGLTADELVSFYGQADLFLHASLSECQPLVVLDAIGAGIPFLSTKSGSVECVDGGLIVETKRQFSEALRHLAADNDERRKLSKAGLRAARNKYNWEQSLATLERTITQIAAHPQ